jgi:hypothetical protein
LIFLPPEQIKDLLDRYQKETNVIKEQIADICYFMKGGVEWNSAWQMSYLDRETVIKVLNRRLKEASPDGKEYM